MISSLEEFRIFCDMRGITILRVIAHGKDLFNRLNSCTSIHTAVIGSDANEFLIPTSSLVNFINNESIKPRFREKSKIKLSISTRDDSAMIEVMWCFDYYMDIDYNIDMDYIWHKIEWKSSAVKKQQDILDDISKKAKLMQKSRIEKKESSNVHEKG